MRLQGLKEAKGGRYRYFRAPGGKLVSLPAGMPLDDPRFLAAYAAAKAEHAPAQAGAPTLRSTALAYFQGRKFRDLKTSTQADRRRIVERIVAGRDDVTVRSIQRRHIQADIDKVTSGAASNRLDAWRALMHHAWRADWIKSDPCEAVELPRHVTQSHPRWTALDLQQYRKRWPLGTQQRTALELLAWTGCRRGDAVSMGWQHVKDGWIVWRQQKTGEAVELPIAQPLADALALVPRTQMTFLETAQGTSRSPKAFGMWFRAACTAAGVTKSAHGLRHDFGSTMAEGEADQASGAAAMGHKSEREQATYRASASRRKLAERAMERLSRERGLETPIAEIGNSEKKRREG